MYSHYCSQVLFCHVDILIEYYSDRILVLLPNEIARGKKPFIFVFRPLKYSLQTLKRSSLIQPVTVCYHLSLASN